ncbi:uracil-DNA glycosylase [Amaricoccus macauensis]|uniref:uracil-DNA glycosylase n=1 Tax=Amaricoccus macauensis TaxID=57001 RepID=UPI003C7D52B2
MLAWLVEMGADEAIEDEPIDRFAAHIAAEEEAAARSQRPARAKATRSGAAAPPLPAQPTAPDTRARAAECATLDALRSSLESFDDCALKKGARNTVFADGNPQARLMIVGEAPGRDEDRQGLPFVGRSGQLLNRMLAAIGFSRHAEAPEQAAYITNVLPWRPPQNRDPSADEISMMLPFLHRHIELAAPTVLVPMGNAAAKTLLETTTGITRLRGNWSEWRGIPVMPMFHPAALLRGPEKKSVAWADLLQIRERLDSA